MPHPSPRFCHLCRFCAAEMAEPRGESAAWLFQNYNWHRVRGLMKDAMGFFFYETRNYRLVTLTWRRKNQNQSKKTDIACTVSWKTQWAAVRTTLGAMIVPPQRVTDLQCSCYYFNIIITRNCHKVSAESQIWQKIIDRTAMWSKRCVFFMIFRLLEDGIIVESRFICS